jgi:uncharacterized protein (DUF433 family)
MATVDYPHVSLDPDGVLLVTGTRTKVLMIVMDHVGYGWDAKEINRQHPYLTLGQIHSALAYYYDHQAEMDAEIAGDLREADRAMAEIERLQGPSPLMEKLERTGQLSRP